MGEDKKAEDIFIDEDLQMSCPASSSALIGNLAKMHNVKVEPLNQDFLMDEESTRSNVAATTVLAAEPQKKDKSASLKESASGAKKPKRGSKK